MTRHDDVMAQSVPAPEHLDAAAWFERLASGSLSRRHEPGRVVLVELDSTPAPDLGELSAWPFVPEVVVGIAHGTRPDPKTIPGAELCDVVVGHDDRADLASVSSTVATNPLAAVALVQLLRGAEARSVANGLLAESAVYSALQAGPEFARWRSSRPTRPRLAEPDREPVLLERSGERLSVVLNRPRVHNALDAAVRDGLVDAFRLVEADPTITAVELRGEGPSFCAGGDLDEFGLRADPASAHILRLDRSAGWAIDRVSERVTAHLHGACMGSGIELPAFARTVLVHPDVRIGLPELSLGLIPGAGGTVSLPRRIGRHRTAWLALTGHQADADVALAWGLADGIDPSTPYT